MSDAADAADAAVAASVFEDYKDATSGEFEPLKEGDPFAEKFKGLFDKNFDLKINGDKCSGYNISGSQNGCYLTLLGVKEDQHQKTTITFRGVDVRFREGGLPMFQDGTDKNGGERAFLPNCSSVEMRGQFQLAEGDTQIQVLGEDASTTYVEDASARSVVVYNNGDKYEFRDGDKEVRYNYRKAAGGWFYGAAMTLDQIEAWEKQVAADRAIAEELREQIGASASAGGLALAVEAVDDTGMMGRANFQMAMGPSNNKISGDPGDSYNQTKVEEDRAAQAAKEAEEAEQKQFEQTTEKLANYDGNGASALKWITNVLLRPLGEGSAVAAGLVSSVFVGMVAYVGYWVPQLMVNALIPEVFNSRPQEKLLRWAQKWVPRMVVGSMAVAAIYQMTYTFPMIAMARGGANLVYLCIFGDQTRMETVSKVAAILWENAPSLAVLWGSVFTLGIVQSVFLGTLTIGLAGIGLARSDRGRAFVDWWARKRRYKVGEAEAAYDAFAKELKKGNGASTRSLQKHAQEVFSADRGHFKSDNGVRSNIFTLLIAQYAEDGVNRAPLLFDLLQLWKRDAKTEPTWEVASDEELSERSVVALQLLNKAFADDRNQLQACVYLALSMWRMPETLRAALTASKSWSDAQTNTDDIVEKNFLDLSQAKSMEAFVDLAKRYYIASRKAEVYTKADDEFWFNNSVSKLASGVRGALRRRLEFFQVKEPTRTHHLGDKRIDDAQFDIKHNLRWSVAFGDRGVRATVTAGSFGNADIDPTVAEAQDAGVKPVEKEGADVYIAESTSKLLRVDAGGAVSSDALLLEAAEIHVKEALARLMTLYRKDDYYFSIERLDLDDTRGLAGNIRAIVAKAVKQPPFRAPPPSATSSGAGPDLDPGPDLNALLADQAASLRRVRELLEED